MGGFTGKPRGHLKKDGPNGNPKDIEMAPCLLVDFQGGHPLPAKSLPKRAGNVGWAQSASLYVVVWMGGLVVREVPP